MFLWIDIDCYECQVWSQLHPELLNGPSIITNKEIIISYDYQVKSFGINKNDSVESARAKCPSLKVFRKLNTSDEVEELSRTRDKIEISIKKFIADEFEHSVQFHWEGNEEGYLNICAEMDLQISKKIKYYEDNTWKTNVKWIFGNNQTEESQDKDDLMRLRISVNMLAEMLRRIEVDTGLYASGSAGTTKTIARLACQLNKPRGITAVTSNGLEKLFTLVNFKNAPGLKGKTGQKILDKWKKPDGTQLKTLEDFKNHVPLNELRAEGYLKGNKLLFGLMSHYADMTIKKNVKNIKEDKLILKR